MNFWQRYIFNSFIAFLQNSIKNPQSLAKEKYTLIELKKVIDQILEQIN